MYTFLKTLFPSEEFFFVFLHISDNSLRGMDTVPESQLGQKVFCPLTEKRPNLKEKKYLFQSGVNPFV